ncbi:MAG: hypothetical protein P4M14_03635, partial [Gammaproteobacteria bacterium]|nr:hypothetical protein [Gammaproteobacteria bacterium]
NGTVSVNDSGNVATTLASLVRTAGENVSGSPYAISAATFNALTGSAAGNYNIPTFTGSPTLTITKASLTGAIANQTKVYGANDPALSGMSVTLGGVINNPAIVTWNGNVSINDTALVGATPSSLTRAVGEIVSGSPYAITAGTFTLSGASAGNYNNPIFTGSPTLTITKASLTGAIADQTKVYGANDPTLSGMGVTLGGVINNPAIVTWNGNVSVNDTAQVSATPSSLTRAMGEVVSGSPYAITAGTFTLSGASAGNYNSPTFAGSPTLTITKASLTGAIADQTKVYGENDPTLSGIGVTLAGIINNANISTWNGTVSVNDSGNVATTLASLARAAGENVSGSPYAISAATFNALTGSAAGNYNIPTFTGSPTLTITKASLTGTIANQTKVYGANDPSLSSIGVTLGGVINNSAIVTWNGNVSVNDAALVSATPSSLTRAVGEIVSGSPYAITAGTFTLSGTSAGNYYNPTFTGSSTLTITKASLTGTIADQTKVYGANDPTLSGIGVTLGGVINNPAIVTWNGNVSVNDTALISATPSSLTRAVGEIVSGSPYAITAGTFTLSGASAGNYNNPTFAGSPTLTITKASLTGSIADQTKVYGANDPTLSGINVTLGGIINNANISTWNGTVSVNDSGNVATTLASLARATGENVSGNPYAISAATFNVLTGTAAGNYNVPTFTGSPTLTITKASLTGSIANQTKVYGANDPALSGMAVTLGGVINNPAIVTWNGNVSVNDTALVSATPSSLTRVVGEIVSGSPYAITAGTFALSGAAAGNYNSPTFTGSPTLTITKASLTGAIADQTKVYGANDPTLSGINVTLGGIINNANISTWNGAVSVNDSGNVATTLASLARAAGENVSGSPYAISAATFNALTGSAAGNYNSPTFAGSPTLSITKASLTGSIANQTKVYGANDPSLSGISVTLAGIINNANISTWNGAVSVNDSGNVVTTLASLARAAGENVSGSPYTINAATFNALTGAAAGNYNMPTFTGSPTLTITKANLTGSIANQTKVYGANDPTLSSIGVTLGGVINNPAIVTWNGNVSVNDTALVSATPSSLTRAVGEIVSGSPYAITAGNFALSGTSAGNYNSPAFTGSPTLTITKASLTGAIADQTKVYGASDPTFSGINVTLGGVINNPAIETWNGNVSVNDTALVSATPSSLTRVVGEIVSGSPYAITAGTFTLSGTSAGNYNSPTFTGSPTLTITKASLTGSIGNQTKVYGENDPTLSGIGVTLAGIINNANISTWNGTVSVNDSGNVATTLASLARAAGENVSGSPYAISAATFNALTGSAAGNYNMPTFSGSPTLTITKASLTGSIGNQTKVYGANDPSVSGIGVTLAGIINNASITTWNGTASINDTGNVATTLASLTRAAGENVSGSPYAINAATFNALTGSAAGNYNIPTFTGSPTLTITKASLTGAIANQTKVYGANDPALSGMSVTLGGVINNPAIVTWNGNVSVNDTALVSATPSSLTRAVGEIVSGSPYAITAGTFTLSGASAGDYNSPTFIGSPTLTITKASLTGAIANQTKVYGANDPAL